MMAYIKGKVEESGENYVVIDNGGIGYQIYMPSLEIRKILGEEVDVKVYTYLYVREDQVSLYGFTSRDSLNLFILLIGVSGIGPKAAISAMSLFDAGDITLAIVTGNEKQLTKCPGIGKKLAQRIILELKDKMKNFSIDSSKEGIGEVTADGLDEGIGALIALGYSPSEASIAVKKVYCEGQKVEDTIRLALKQLIKG